MFWKLYLETAIPNKEYEDCSAHYHSFSFGGWYFSNKEIKIELAAVWTVLVWTFQDQDVWNEFGKINNWNFEFSISETHGNMYGRKYWLKIGQDQEMAAVALLNIDVRKAFCDWTLVSLDIFSNVKLRS